jgi:hypothetical protein
MHKSQIMRKYKYIVPRNSLFQYLHFNKTFILNVSKINLKSDNKAIGE